MVTTTHYSAQGRKPRLVFPDVARGFMLLSIALANVVTAWGQNDASPHANPDSPVVYDGSTVDAVTIVIGAVGVHVRGLPLFCTLLGFGIGLICNSLQRRCFPRGAAKIVIAKRYSLLAAIGAVHCLFLFYGDIMLAYGLTGVLIALLIGLSNKALGWIAGLLYALNVIMFLGLAAGLAAFDVEALGSTGNIAEEFGLTLNSYGEALLAGLIGLLMSSFGLVTQLPMILPPMLVGLIFARKGYGRLTAQNSRALWIWCALMLCISFGIGLPLGLAQIGVLSAQWAITLDLVNTAFGPLTGPGLFAFFALACSGLQRLVDAGGRLPLVLRPVNALGKRSMSGYVGQSALFFILVYPFTLNLTEGWGATKLSLLAIGVWLVTALIAWILEANAIPGPLEKLHRRLSYGKQGLPQRWTPTLDYRSSVSGSKAEC